jgi:hypothetical protein
MPSHSDYALSHNDLPIAAYRPDRVESRYGLDTAKEHPYGVAVATRLFRR